MYNSHLKVCGNVCMYSHKPAVFHAYTCMYVPLSVSLLLGEAEEAAHGVGARGEHEDEGSDVGHVLVQSGQSHWWTLHELRAQVVRHKVNGGKHNLQGRKE